MYKYILHYSVKNHGWKHARYNLPSYLIKSGYILQDACKFMQDIFDRVTDSMNMDQQGYYNIGEYKLTADINDIHKLMKPEKDKEKKKVKQK